MTLYGWGNPRYFPALPRPVKRYFDVAGHYGRADVPEKARRYALAPRDLAPERMGFVEAKDLNDAIQVAARIPGARFGSVEVRPIMDFSKESAQHKGAETAGSRV